MPLNPNSINLDGLELKVHVDKKTKIASIDLTQVIERAKDALEL